MALKSPQRDVLECVGTERGVLETFPRSCARRDRRAQVFLSGLVPRGSLMASQRLQKLSLNPNAEEPACTEDDASMVAEGILVHILQRVARARRFDFFSLGAPNETLTL